MTWLLAAGGCGLFGPAADIIVVLPAPPAPWQERFPGLRFTVVAEGPRGEECSVEAMGWGQAVELRVTKAGGSPILAYPWCAAGPALGVLPPAGGVFPDCITRSSGGELFVTLAWEDGPAAAVLRALRRAGTDTGTLNTRRLMERMRAAADPWTWDLTALAEALAGGVFTAYYLDPAPSADVSVAAGPGSWFLESPFSAAVPAGPGGVVLLRALPFGMHTLFGPEGKSMGVFLDVGGAVVVGATGG